MKKRILTGLALCAISATFASCGSKLCYCYENGYEQELYISPDVACNAYSTASRGCVEQHERMDPGQVAYK